jgi:hypothetical protein
MPECTYLKIFLNRINEFKAYTVNYLKRGGGGKKEEKIRGRRSERGAIGTTLSEIGKRNNV